MVEILLHKCSRNSDLYLQCCSFVICAVNRTGNTSGMAAQRAHRPTVRGLAARLKSASDQDAASTDSEECHVYSNRVAEVFDSLPQMPFPSLSPFSSGLSCQY